MTHSPTCDALAEAAKIVAREADDWNDATNVRFVPVPLDHLRALRAALAEYEAGQRAFEDRPEIAEVLRIIETASRVAKRTGHQFSVNPSLLADFLNGPGRQKEAEPKGWRTMDSAPKDGTWVLLWWPSWVHVPWPAYYEKYVGWYCDRAPDDGGECEYGPTHWMPLPPEPQT